MNHRHLLSCFGIALAIGLTASTAPAADAPAATPASSAPPATTNAPAPDATPATPAPAPTAAAAPAATPAPAPAVAPAAPAAPETAAAAPDTSADDLAATKAKLARSEAELDAALRTYTLLKQDYDKVSAEAATAQDAKQQAEDAKAQLNKMAPQLNELASLREILRHTQDTNATLSAQNAQLTAALAQRNPGLAASLNAPVRPQPVNLAPVTPAPEAAAAPRHHTVGKSDSLTKLSLKYYGNANRWQDILKANPKVIKNPNVLPLGADIIIP